MERSEINKVRDLPIGQVAQQLGLEIHRGMTYCLWHTDKNPSLELSAKRNNCHCYSCKHTADVIELVEKVTGKTFREACEWLADNHGLILETKVSDGGAAPGRPYKQYPPDLVWLNELVQHPVLIPEAMQFLEERRIDPRVVQWCGLSSTSTPLPCYRGGRNFYEAPSLLIPYRDEQGRVLSVQSRYLGDAKANGVPRFRFPRNAPTQIFNLAVLPMLQGYEELQICEGVSDCLAALSAGHKAIAIGSATLLRGDALAAALTPHLSHWAGTLVCYPDRDEAGRAFAAQLTRVANDMHLPLVLRDLPAVCKDFGDWWKSRRT